MKETQPAIVAETLQLNGEIFNMDEIRRLAGIMRAIDYLYAGDHDEESCLEEIKELEIEADPR